MTVAQMKHYLKPGALQKLDNAELGQLLSASRGIRDHFAKERGWMPRWKRLTGTRPKRKSSESFATGT